MKYIIYPHNGYVFGGVHDDDLFYNNTKSKYLLPYDCSTWISYLLGWRPLDTKLLYSIRNVKFKEGFIDISFIKRYDDFKKLIQNSDFYVKDIQDPSEIEVGDIFIARTFNDKNIYSEVMGSSGHTGIIVDRDEKNMIILSYTRDYDNLNIAGGLFQKVNIGKYMKYFGDTSKFFIFRKKNKDNIIVHTQNINEDCTLEFKNKKYKCSYGKKGFSKDKIEGDFKVPIGKFPLRRVLYREDKVIKPETKLDIFKIQKDDIWCDDSNSILYNKQIKKNEENEHLCTSYEFLSREDDLYDIVVILGHNDDPIVKGAGSAIFLHIAKPNYVSSSGCIGVSKEDLLEILKNTNKETKIEIIG
ncbi:L,D-transpeptidase [Pseudomonadota bacterium]